MSYYLYKLWVKGSDKYYIGITCNPVQRKNCHFSKIYSLLRLLKYNKLPVRSGILSCHVELAKILIKRTSILKITPEIKNRLRFRILTKRDLLSGIFNAEARFIKKAKEEHILNIAHRC